MRTKKLMINTIFSLLEDVVAIICAFILPRLILSYFGSKYNGLITSITQFLACAILLRSGIGGATRAALYKPLADKDYNKINSIVKATDLFMKKIAIILLVLIIIFSLGYATFFSGEFEWGFTFTLFIIIGISTFAESFFGITYLIILQADQRLWISSLIKSISYILNILLATFLITNNCGIHIVKFGSAVAFVLYPLVLNFYVKRKYKIKLKGVKPDNSAISQRWDAFWHQTAIFVNTNTDVIILTFFSNMIEVSVYSIYNLVVTGLRRFITAFTNGVEGSFGDMIAKKEKKSLLEALSIIELVVYSASIVLYTTAMLLIIQFITIYTHGITDANYFRPIFAYILLFAGFIRAARLPYYFIIQAAGHFRQTKKYAIIEVVINVGLSIILVIKFGLIGVAIGTLISALYKTIMYAIYISKNIINRNLRTTCFKFLIGICEMALILTIVNFLPLNMDGNIVHFILNGFIIVAISGLTIGVGILIFYKKEFKGLMNKINNIFKRKKAKNEVQGI